VLGFPLANRTRPGKYFEILNLDLVRYATFWMGGRLMVSAGTLTANRSFTFDLLPFQTPYQRTGTDAPRLSEASLTLARRSCGCTRSTTSAFAVRSKVAGNTRNTDDPTPLGLVIRGGGCNDSNVAEVLAKRKPRDVRHSYLWRAALCCAPEPVSSAACFEYFLSRSFQHDLRYFGFSVRYSCVSNKTCLLCDFYIFCP
jgi:hypothetical protein